MTQFHSLLFSNISSSQLFSENAYERRFRGSFKTCSVRRIYILDTVEAQKALVELSNIQIYT